MLTTRSPRAFPGAVDGTAQVARDAVLRRHFLVVASLFRTSYRAHDPASVLAAKGDHTVAVCLPARDEEATVGEIVTAIRETLQEQAAVVDELVVIDDHSVDRTAAIAAEAGATVIDARTVLPGAGGPGKGTALWRSLHQTRSDIVVWLDADIEDFSPHFVTGLVGTLVAHPEITFVKGSYSRPTVDGLGGGRVTELLARPTLATLFPEVAAFRQPLSGEFGGRRSLLERLPFVAGYGVDIALLIDAVHVAGLDGVAEVDLGERRHRNRTLDQLGPQATEVLRAALSRAGIGDHDHPVVLRRPDTEPLLIAHRELPPLAEPVDDEQSA